MHDRKALRLITGGIALATVVAMAPTQALATPYAYASNLITGLTLTNADGTSIADVTSATTHISDSAQFGSYAPAANQAIGTVGNASTIPQAFSGIGSAPSTFSQTAPGTFTGTRANAAIGAGNAANGGVAVSNVAEGYGSQIGNSTASNSATVTFTVTGTGQAVHLTAKDLYSLLVSSAANPQETATASISNNFSVTPQNGGSPVATYPTGNTPLNQQISSQMGTPPSNSSTGTATIDFLTGVLDLGTTYNISLTSTATENIQPGTAVPEPASLALLGVGLLGLAVIPRRKG